MQANLDFLDERPFIFFVMKGDKKCFQKFAYGWPLLAD